MSTSGAVHNAFVTGIEDLRGSWIWFLITGILLMLVGFVCIIGDVTATFATVLVFGWVLLISGVFALVHAIRTMTWNGFMFYLLIALFRGFTGYLLIKYPLAGAVSLTLLLASFFVVTGLFRTIAASAMRLPRWTWSVLSGIVSLVLGIVLLVQMPNSSLWFIGFAIGVDLVFDGGSLIGLATAINSLPKSKSYQAV